MTIETIKPKNIFKVAGDVYFIPVNCVGVMGAGIAKEFKERFPELYEHYVRDCKYNVITVGNPVVYDVDNVQYVMFPTKDNWTNPSNLVWIAQGLETITDLIGESINEKSILVIPPLGCGKGKLNYNDVKKVIEEFANHVPNPVIMIPPIETSAL